MASATDFVFLGNNLALDFVNTELQGPSGRIELLQSDAALLAWAQAAGLGEQAPGSRASRERLDRRARPLRAAIRGLVEARIDGQGASPDDLSTLNELLTHPARAPALVQRRGGFARAPVADLTPASVLQRIAAEAAELLTTADPALLRRCGDSRCILVFYDTSKSHRRRWCSMSACGNRAKASGHYQRTRGQ
jgi:predicted RNA-binding Zn ribbon-like protein